MAQNIVKFLVRRGPDLDRQATILQDGELAYTTDINAKRLFVGDGITPGGWPVASRFFPVANWADNVTLNYVQINDLVFVRSDNALYALTGVGATPLSANYLKVGKL
jgi:hypothetical protein